MNKNELVIATMTWARDATEEALLREAIGNLVKLEVSVYITDGGSGESFLEFLRSFPNITLLQPAKGVWQQVKSSLTAAYVSGAEYIFYTEPDKAVFFANGLPDLLNAIEVNAQTGVYVAARSAEAFKTFPAFQQMTETTINACCAELIRSGTDYVYGPFLVNRNLVPYLNSLPTNIDWGWRPYAFNIAKRLGYTVESFTGDFLCPVSQRDDSNPERLYRMRQLTQNIEGLMLSNSASLEIR